MDDLLTHWEGEPTRTLEALWSVPAVEAWRTIGSTNDRARELARAGAEPFTVVLAEEQTAGRGRGGRRWSSPPGAGLWMSVLLRPRVRRATALAPILAGLAVCRAVEGAGVGRAFLKWPNDVLLEGRKVSGILCEAAGETVVAGIGVNVRQEREDFPPELRARATSLEREAGARISRVALTGRIVSELKGLLERPTLRLDGAVAEEVASRDALRGRPVRVGGGPDGKFDGVATGIDPTGALRVAGADGTTRAVVAGTVRVRAHDGSPA